MAIDTVHDIEVIFQDLPIERISTSFTINATAAIILAMYVTIASRRGDSPRLPHWHPANG